MPPPVVQPSNRTVDKNLWFSESDPVTSYYIAKPKHGNRLAGLYCPAYLHLVNAKHGASTGQASKRMQQFHCLVVRELKDRSLQSIVHTYTWNDSALVVSKVDKSPGSFGQALRDLHGFKKAIDNLLDTLCPSFAIAVKGQTFPLNEPSANLRATILQTSSWAMANCFEIEKVLRREQASWYVDTRIVRKVQGLGTVFLYKNNQLFAEV